MKDILLYRKRKSKKEAEKQIKLNYIQSKRLIKNNLGSFESILGSSPKLAAKKVTKKPVTVSKRRKTSSK